MDILVLEGTPRQRGRTYGESLRPKIQDAMGQFWEGICQTAGISSKEIIADWLRSTNYLPSIEQWTPQLLEEVRGIAEGAGADFDSIFAWQLLDEFNWYVDLFTSRKAVAKGIGQCSTVGVFAEGDGVTRLAQNWDSMVMMGEYLTLLHIKEPATGLETFVIAASGRIGPFGLNNRGTGICMNGLTEFLNSSGEGLPVVFIGRGALEQGASQAAACFVQNVRHATAQNYAVGGPEAIWMYEGSANRVRHVPVGGTRLVHANHPLVNNDQRISNRSPEIQNRNWEKTTTRYGCMEKRLADHTQPVTLETIKGILGSHDSPDMPVCRHAGADGPVATVAGMIMELSSQQVLHLAEKHPCQAEFKRFSFAD